METVNSLITALQILQPLYGDEPISFHDGRLFAGDYEPERLTDKEKQTLQDLGWDEGEGSWCLECD